MWQFLRLLIGVLLLPFSYGITKACFQLFRIINKDQMSLIPPEGIGFVLGFFLFLGIWFFLPLPLRLYILGHELTHALWGIVFGARVSKIKVNATNGYVKLSKSNLVITLAPYFFPFYTIIIVIIALITQIFIRPLPCPPAWMFAIGFSWCFHVCFTIKSLTVRQPDILEYGRLFSWNFIWIVNVLGVITWTILTTNIDALHACFTVGITAGYAYESAFNFIKSLIAAVCHFFTAT